MADVDTDPAFEADTEVVVDGAFSESTFRSAPYFDVKIDGIILYVSCDNVTVTGKDSVSIKEGTGIEKTWITESEEVPSTETVLETESTEDAGDVIEGEVIIGTEEASGNDVVTNLSGGSSGTDVYTYIIYK